MIVRLKKGIKVDPCNWYYNYVDRDIIFNVEVDSNDASYYSVVDWEQYVSPFDIKHFGLCGLRIAIDQCEVIEYRLQYASGNKLVFTAGKSKKYVFIMPEINANHETTYVMSKIMNMPMHEALFALGGYGFDIYTKAEAVEGDN